MAKATSERYRSVYFAGAGAKIETRVVGRESLRPNIVIQGPLIIDEWTMTTVVPPGWQAAADDLGNLILIPIMASPITSPTRQ